MPTSYPGGLDNFTNPTASDTLDSATVPHAAQHANLNDAVEAIEAELGVNAKGSFASVAARISSSESEVVSLDQYAAEGSVLQNIPSRVHSAEQLLKQAVFWIDAAHSSASGQTVTNLGWGGSALNATAGSSGSVDSNDPKFLDWSGINYVFMPSGTDNRMIVNNSAALKITDDLDVRVHIRCDDWTPADIRNVITGTTAWPSPGYKSWNLNIQTSGTLRLVLSNDGNTLLTYTSTVSTGIADGSSKWVRFTRARTAGEVKFFLSDDGNTWTQLGSTITGATTDAIFYNAADTGSLNLGQINTVFNSDMAVFRAQVLNGIDGTPVLDVDTSVIPSGNATSFTANTGQTVTIGRATSGRKTTVVTHPVWLFGADDYMEVADNNLLDFNASESFMLLAITRQWSPFTTNGRLLSKRAAPTGNLGYDFYMGSTTQQDGFIGDGTNTAFGTGFTSTVTAGVVNAGAYVVNRSTQLVTTYANGTASAGRSISTIGSLSTAATLMIGAGKVGGSPSSYFDGEVYAVAVFRRALTAAEIATLTGYYQGRIG